MASGGKAQEEKRPVFSVWPGNTHRHEDLDHQLVELQTINHCFCEYVHGMNSHN